MRKYFLLVIFLPIFAFANEINSGFYGTFETGFEYLNLQTNDKQTKVNQNNLHTFRVKGGYEFDTGWRFGLNLNYTASGAQFDMSGSPFVRGADTMPYRAIGGTNTMFFVAGLQGGYHVIRSQEQDLYINAIFFTEADSHVTTFPLRNLSNNQGIKLELEGRNLILPKWSVGYTLGTSWTNSYTEFMSSDEDYMQLTPVEKRERAGFEDDAAWAKVGGVWGLHGDVKWIYHMTQSTNFFVKWDFQVKLYPKSETIRINVTDVLHNRSLGEMSIHTPKYRVFRSGIAIGAAF